MSNPFTRAREAQERLAAAAVEGPRTSEQELMEQGRGVAEAHVLGEVRDAMESRWYNELLAINLPHTKDAGDQAARAKGKVIAYREACEGMGIELERIADAIAHGVRLGQLRYERVVAIIAAKEAALREVQA